MWVNGPVWRLSHSEGWNATKDRLNAAEVLVRAGTAGREGGSSPEEIRKVLRHPGAPAEPAAMQDGCDCIVTQGRWFIFRPYTMQEPRKLPLSPA